MNIFKTAILLASLVAAQSFAQFLAPVPMIEKRDRWEPKDYGLLNTAYKH